MEAKGPQFGIIFVSSDREEESMKSYFGDHGDYLVLQFSDRTAKTMEILVGVF